MRPLFVLLLMLGSAAFAQTTPDCPTTPLVAGETASGTLAATDCRLRDMIAGNTNASYAKRYRLEVSSQGVFPVTIGSPDFPATVSIYSGTQLRAQASALQSATGRLTINLPTGAYTLYVYSGRAEATGGFELKADRENARPCPINTLEAAGTVEGAFTESSCRFVDLSPFSVSTNHIAFYQVEMPRRGALSLTADTAIANFSTVLSTPAGAAFRALKQMTVSLLPGTAVVSFSSALAGSYTIRTAVQDLRTCPQAQGRLGEETTGEITETGCRWLDLFVPSDDVSPVSLVKFSSDTRAIGQLDLRSTLFDSFLVLSDARTGAVIAFNDNASTGVRDSRILANLPPGEYLAMATSATGSGRGAFTMNIASQAPRRCEAVGLSPGETVNGSVPDGDSGCRLIDYMSYSTLLTPVAPFVFDSSQATMLGLKAEGAVSSTVRLLTPTGQEVARGNADRNGELNSEFRIPSGAHTVLVTSTANPRPAFKLTAQTRALPACPPEPLALGPEVESVLTTVDCKLSELANYFPVPVPAKAFIVKVTERGTLRARIESAEFGPYVAVLDSTASPLAAAGVPGNSGGVTLGGPVEPGEYTIAVSSLGATLGAFKLQATFIPASGAITPPVIAGRARTASRSGPQTQDQWSCESAPQTEAMAPVFSGCMTADLGIKSVVKPK